MTTRKEDIMAGVETAIRTIKKGDIVTFDSGETYTFQNTMSYVDRQFINVTENEIKNAKMPWCIINNEGERFNTLVGGSMENKIVLHIVGLIKADSNNKNLDTLMNNLQKDILVAILLDETLGNTCSYLYPLEINTVDSMSYPYGGFVTTFEITYSCQRLKM